MGLYETGYKGIGGGTQPFSFQEIVGHSFGHHLINFLLHNDDQLKGV